MSLQKDVARNGQAIFKLGGRSVVSSFDPMKEARGWAANAVQEIGDRETAIVLGAACGYHLIALRELRPTLSLLTIEADTAIAAFAEDILAKQPDFEIGRYGQILTATRAIELTESLELRDFMTRRFAVVTHAGLAQARPDWTREIAQFLTGRDFLSFLLQLRMRPELHALFDEEKISRLKVHAGPISILTIRNLFANDSHSKRERRMWRVLEELIV